MATGKDQGSNLVCVLGRPGEEKYVIIAGSRATILVKNMAVYPSPAMQEMLLALERD